ncbi:uncharacterized protein LOC112187243 isoform X2 [Rosa chinensis]|uniref:uncharacterized protein LOC112187243 isoform X2 n=1 Tax=Rosa chinensis TaxID=74649 RepID=UPI001AD8C92F|nr:uncharacterized protein LOC112187243 isoform X2 [Rosa chinensis]
MAFAPDPGYQALSKGLDIIQQPSEAEAGHQESLEKRIAEEWMPSSRNMTYMFKQKVSMLDNSGKPVLASTDSSNPWCALLEEVVSKAYGTLGKPEICPASTDAHYFQLQGLPAIGFSPMANTHFLLHDHNEVVAVGRFQNGGAFNVIPDSAEQRVEEVEHVVREEKLREAYELIEIYCELIAARLPMFESQKNCLIDLEEAVSSVIFARGPTNVQVPPNSSMANKAHVEAPPGPLPPDKPPNAEVPRRNYEFQDGPVNSNEQIARSSPRLEDSASTNVSANKATTSTTFHPETISSVIEWKCMGMIILRAGRTGICNLRVLPLQHRQLLNEQNEQASN